MYIMLRLLEKELPHAGPKDILWKYKSYNAYNKHTQHVPQIVEKPANEPMKETIMETIMKPIMEPANEPMKESIMEPANEPMKETKAVRTPKAVKAKKETSIKPLDVILQETNTFPHAIDKVKGKLVEVLSLQEYIKVFGAKKSAEMMTGIVNNKWNKSTALFLSFLFDKTIVYLQENILYNKEKNNGVIII